jgi:hypothetical protein
MEFIISAVFFGVLVHITPLGPVLTRSARFGTLLHPPLAIRRS